MRILVATVFVITTATRVARISHTATVTVSHALSFLPVLLLNFKFPFALLTPVKFASQKKFRTDKVSHAVTATVALHRMKVKMLTGKLLTVCAAASDTVL